MLRNHTSSYQSDQWFKTAYLIRRRDSPIDSPLPLSSASRRITSESTKCRMRTYTGSNSSTGTRSRFAARCPTYWLPCPTQYRSAYGQITSNTEFYPSHRAARYRLSWERDRGAFAIKFPSQLRADKAAKSTKPCARKPSPKAEGPGVSADVFNLVTRRRRVNLASQERSHKRRINSN